MDRISRTAGFAESLRLHQMVGADPLGTPFFHLNIITWQLPILPMQVWYLSQSSVIGQ